MEVTKALKEIAENYTAAFSNDKIMRAILKDYFPEDRRIQNTLMMVVDEGILEDMQGKSSIDKIQMFGYVKGIVNGYGVSEEIAKTAVLNWAEALEIEVDKWQPELCTYTITRVEDSR